MVDERVGNAWRAAAVVVAGGVAAGLIGAGMALLLRAVQFLTFGADAHGLADAIRQASPARVVLGPAVGGVLAGLGWWWLRRTGGTREVMDALGTPGRLGLARPLADALLQILVVGSGASIGREGAPRQASAAVTDAIVRRVDVGPAARALVAAAAGAGLAAVYNVPVSGVLFALEVLLIAASWRAILLAVPMCAIATVVAWPVVTPRPVYEFAGGPVDAVAVVWTIAAIPMCALVGTGFARLARAAAGRQPAPGWRLPLAMGGAGAAVGASALVLPELPGNGIDLMQVALLGSGTLAGYGAFLLLKPLATALCLRSGAVGGLLTPALSTGAALGGVVALGLGAMGLPTHLPVFALVGAAGLLAVTQRAPLFAAVMTWELVHPPLAMLPLLLAVAYASHGVARIMAHRGGPAAGRA